MVYAFQFWYNGNDVQTSALYENEEAEQFAEVHNSSNTFATLVYGGEDVLDLYENFINN
jgi:hypothetical protein